MSLLLEITNESEMLPTNSSVIVDRVPIEFADYSNKPPTSLSREIAFFTRNQDGSGNYKKSFDRDKGDNGSSKGNGAKNDKTNKKGETGIKRYQGLYTMEELNYMLENARFYIMR